MNVDCQQLPFSGLPFVAISLSIMCTRSLRLFCHTHPYVLRTLQAQPVTAYRGVYVYLCSTQTNPSPELTLQNMCFNTPLIPLLLQSSNEPATNSNSTPSLNLEYGCSVGQANVDCQVRPASTCRVFKAKVLRHTIPQLAGPQKRKIPQGSVIIDYRNIWLSNPIETQIAYLSIFLCFSDSFVCRARH